MFRLTLLFLSKIAALNDSKTALWTQQGIHLEVVHQILNRPSKINAQFCVHIGGAHNQLIDGLRKLMAVSTVLHHFKVFAFDSIVIFINGDLDLFIASKHVDLINNIKILAKMPMPLLVVVEARNPNTIRAIRSEGVKCMVKEMDAHG